MNNHNKDTQLQNLQKKDKRKAIIGGRPKVLNIPRGWLHQSFIYLDNTQRLCRIVFETASLMFWTWLFKNLTSSFYSNCYLWIFSAFFTHTLFWIFDSNWWAGIMFTFPWIKNPGEQTTVDYLNWMASRLRYNKSISGVLLYGSISRNQWHNRSDLDMRLLRRPGFINGLSSILILYRERIIALLTRQPLDIYIADGIEFLNKMRKDENPVLLKKTDERLNYIYPHNEPIIIKKLKCES